MTRRTDTTITLLLGTGPQSGSTVAALRLAEAAVDRGHRVAVYAYGDGVRTGAVGSATADHVAGLLRRGVHGGTTSWVVDEAELGRCAAARQVPGAVPGDGGDLWRFVCEADVSLGVTD
jgi:sulfur relay (sulfurtransferase) complex TusBCD TusD component (DsrE family)